MKLHFNPETLLNKSHCASELAPLSEDIHAHTSHAFTHAHTNAFLREATHTLTHTHAVSGLCSPKVIRANEALRGLAAFCVFSPMMGGFAPRPQRNKRMEGEGQKLC